MMALMLDRENSPRYPSLYQINTRVWLQQISLEIGRTATLDDISDAELDRYQSMGFDWLWFLSVWETGERGKAISRSHPSWQKDFHNTLSDLREEDIIGSGFAIRRYVVAEQLGGEAALARLRARLQDRGMRLMLDFVPNHGAPDHPWLEEHPEYFIEGSEEDFSHAPQNFIRVPSGEAEKIVAMGRDPYFDGWPDTVQFNYGNPALQVAMAGELSRIATQCDGVRCDMAMLLLPEVFQNTWGRTMQDFWPQAIASARAINPQFLLMAEVYWEMEWAMQQQGFDYAYDKRLYDRLHEGHARPVREHLQAELAYQKKLALFLENHDEPRAAATFPLEQHAADAIITFFTPGLRLFHQGQFEGRMKRISPHLGRAPIVAVNIDILKFYDKLLRLLRESIFREGNWNLLECVPASIDNRSHEAFIGFAWRGANEKCVVIAVNYSEQAGQCFVRLPFSELSGKTWKLIDLSSADCYEREGDLLEKDGLYLDVSAWKHHVFELHPCD
jgi:hypothetical protein